MSIPPTAIPAAAALAARDGRDARLSSETPPRTLAVAPQRAPLSTGETPRLTPLIPGAPKLYSADLFDALMQTPGVGTVRTHSGRTQVYTPWGRFEDPDHRVALLMAWNGAPREVRDRAA